MMIQGVFSVLASVFLLMAFVLCGATARAGGSEDLIMEESMKSGFVQAGDVQIAWRQYGPLEAGSEIPAKASLGSFSGPPLVLIMGYGGLMEMWPPALIQGLARDRRVIVFDNRGMGFSGSSDAPYSIELFAEDALAVLDGLGIERAHVLGWSMGAFIAQELVLRHPRRVDRLILLTGSCGGEAAIWPDEATWKSLTDLSGTLEERIQRMLNNLFPQDWLRQNPDPSAYLPPITAPIIDAHIQRQAQTLCSWPGTRDRLPTVTNSTLIITGTEDRVIPPQNAHILTQALPHARAVEIQGGGHGVMYQEPERLAGLVGGFLAVE
ncbi:alpha/beta fold hydrolase [Desulfonatronum sp. SC1]|uniref:alpha/beta fold hydrolase n=1 Tax=Desulfonatronum sp. SC1 TaxID=2109626 RepID=UPI000D2FE4EA|nr:alpha/beta hydrolase [Desulfonatronum sp. SC1]PTN38068.1 alpha/beta hydrolase [Desulfonatronum sp. SC1]